MKTFRKNNKKRGLFTGKIKVYGLEDIKLRPKMGNRLAFLFCVIMLAFLLLAVRVVVITTKNYDTYAVEVFSNYSYTSKDLTAARGTITDRNGNTLAISEAEYILIIEPQNILKPQYTVATIAALVQAFELDETEIKEILNGNPLSLYYRYRESDGKTVMTVPLDKIEAFEAIQKDVNVASTKNKLTALAKLLGITPEAVKSTYKDYNEFMIGGVWFEKRYERVYPYDSLACKVIGSYSPNYTDASTGIEKSYNDNLTGTDGKSYGYLNGDYNLSSQIVNAIQGDTVVSTLDVEIQKIVEEEIASYMESIGAENVGVVVMNPNNGEIYAMATDKNYNLNEPSAKPDSITQGDWDAMENSEKSEVLNEIYKNFCISSSFEPGSVYKAFAVATAYEEGKLAGNETFYCGGYRVVNGWKIRCHNREGCGELNIFEALENSCNVCLMQIGDLIGKQDFTTYFNRFNFGKKTGIDLPGEMDTSALVYKDFTTQPDVTLACASFGQGFNVTMVEVCAAFSSLVNGGYYYTPHVVKEVQSVDGTIVYKADTSPQFLTISKETSDYMKEALYAVVQGGTAATVQVKGYNIGGKTGSAEMVINGKRAEDEWVCSIITACPIENPQLVIYSVIDRGKDPEDYSNSLPAQRLSKAIYERVLPYLNIHSNLDEYDYIEIPPTQAPVESSYEDAAITAEVGDVETDPVTGLIIETEPSEDPSETLPAEVPEEPLPAEPTPAPQAAREGEISLEDNLALAD